MQSTTWRFGAAWSLNKQGSVVLYVAAPEPARAIAQANGSGLVTARPLEPSDPAAAMLRARTPAPPPARRRRGKLRAAPPPAVDAPLFVVAVAARDFESFVRWLNGTVQPRYFPRAEDAVDVLTDAVPYELLPWSGMSSL